MKTIIEMAREVFDITTDPRGRMTFSADSYGLERFAELVRADERELVLVAAIDGAENAARKAIADEREACAKVCEDAEEYPQYFQTTSLPAAIRARGNT